MMTFWKYVAHGNDFIIIDARAEGADSYVKGHVSKWCQRKYGVGADGLIAVERSQRADYKMRFFNGDGAEVSMCGNGLRSFAHFVHHQLDEEKKTDYLFELENSDYHCKIMDDDQVEVEMTELYQIDAIDLAKVKPTESPFCFYVNTGVPHAVFELEKGIENYDVLTEGKRIHDSALFEQSRGVNVNFFQVQEDEGLRVRTFERGVNSETDACGTGVMASVFSHLMQKSGGDRNKIEASQITVHTNGGALIVRFEAGFEKRYMKGAVKNVFRGVLCV